MLSGSSVCGDLPPICYSVVPGRQKVAFCDVDVLPLCPDRTAVPPVELPPPIRIGTPNRPYGEGVLEVYKQVMEASGLHLETVSNMAHVDMYPLFTEMPPTKNTIDIVVGSDLPVNHGRFLEGKHDLFNIVGTLYEMQAITLVVPSTSPVRTLSDLAAAAYFSDKTVYTFDVAACPVCGEFAEVWVEKRLPGFRVRYCTMEELSTIATTKLVNGDMDFVVASWTPHGFNENFDLVVMDMEEFLTPEYLNQGKKALIRKDAEWKVGVGGMSLLRAVMVPTNEVAKMDLAQTRGATAAEAASEWIARHEEIVEMWSW
jgi:ABC-type proline/glycine betaine transport system substrate-binding protein